MSSKFSDRELLYGILAVQMGLVDRDDLVEAIKGKIAGAASSLGQILLTGGALSADTKELVDALVEQHLSLHNNDPVQSLAALSTVGSLVDELGTLRSAELSASLAHVASQTTRPPNSSVLSGPTKSTVADGGRFRVLRLHAKGGIGQVSVAVDDELSREVALKELQPRYADDAASRSRFILEAEITGGLEHPGVVPVYGLGHYADGRPFYAMRFIQGDSLHDASQRFRQALTSGTFHGGYELELRKLLRRFIDVCDAMEYAHSRGVLHRDLKPGNIMLGRYGETLVVDWGLAKLGTTESPGKSPEAESVLHPDSADQSAPTKLGSTIGTPNYMSPEQAAGELNKLGPASDVYSLGATLYHVLTGRPPFEDADVGVVLSAVQAALFPRPREIDARIAKPLEAICLKAMARNPEDRYASARELAEDIERHLADEPTRAKPDSALDRILRWTRKHRGTTLAAGVGLLLLAAVSAIAYVAVSAERDEARRQRDRAIASEEKAQQNFLAAEAARQRAQQQEQRAERVAYNSTLSEAGRLLGSDPMMARSLLEDETRCSPALRDFLWRCLKQQTVREIHSIPLDNPRAFALDYSPLGDTLATAGMNSGVVTLWNTRSGTRAVELATGLQEVHEVLFSPDGRQIAAVAWDPVEDENENWTGLSMVSIEVWDVAADQLMFARLHEVSSNSLLTVSEAGFFVHSLLAETEYAQTHPEYNQQTTPDYRDGVPVIRWYQWTAYDVQTDSEHTKYLRLAEGTKFLSTFQVSGQALACVCGSPAGLYMWIYNYANQTSTLFPVPGSGKDTDYLPMGRTDSVSSFLQMSLLEDSVSEVDSFAFLGQIEFDADISVLQFDVEQKTARPNIALGRFHTGFFIEDERDRFADIDNDGNRLAMLFDRRPLMQLVDLNHSDVIHLIPAHLGGIVSVEVSADGRRLASVGLDRTLRVWDFDQLCRDREPVTPKVVRPRRLLVSPTDDQILLLALGPDPADYDTGDLYPAPSPGEVQIPPLDKEANPELPPLFQAERIRVSNGESLSVREFQKPAERTPTASGSILDIVGALSEGIGAALAGAMSTHPISNMANETKLSSDGTQLILASSGGLYRFDLNSGAAEELWNRYYPAFQKAESLQKIVVSDDLQLFATLTTVERSIRVYDLDAQELKWEMPAGDGRPINLWFVPGSHALFVLRESEGGDVQEPVLHAELWDLSANESHPLDLPVVEESDLLKFSPDGKLLVQFRDLDREVKVFDLATGTAISQLNVVREVPLGMLAGSDLLMLAGDNGELKFWDTFLDQYRAELRVLENERIAEALLSRDRNTLVVLGELGSLRFLGADRLRDDLADIRTLTRLEVVSPPVTGAEATATEQGLQAENNPTAESEELPRIDVVDQMPSSAVPSEIEQDAPEPAPLVPGPPAPAT